MGQAKNRGTFDQRQALARAARDVAVAKLKVWQEEVEAFRKTFGLDVGLIGGAPPEARLVVCKFDALKDALKKKPLDGPEEKGV